MASEVISGARAIFKVGGQPVGYALDVSGSTGINYQPLNVLGHLEVVEHVPVSYVVSLNASMARIANGSRLNKKTSFPGLRSDLDGNLESPQLMPAFGTNGLNILQSGELSATIYDLVTKTSLYEIVGIKAENKNWNLAPGSILAEQISFVARISHEADELDATVGQ